MIVCISVNTIINQHDQQFNYTIVILSHSHSTSLPLLHTCIFFNICPDQSFFKITFTCSFLPTSEYSSRKEYFLLRTF